MFVLHFGLFYCSYLNANLPHGDSILPCACEGNFHTCLKCSVPTYQHYSHNPRRSNTIRRKPRPCRRSSPPLHSRTRSLQCSEVSSVMLLSAERTHGERGVPGPDSVLVQSAGRSVRGAAAAGAAGGCGPGACWVCPGTAGRARPAGSAATTPCTPHLLVSKETQ